MRILVAIASYGRANDRYLARVIDEYKSMLFDVDMVVLSNAAKPVPPGVELIVGLPNCNPWSLPFAHKKVLASRISGYDLFVYSEDDILITESNLHAFLRLAAVLPPNELPGFLRFESGPDGKISYPDFHVNFRWDPSSARDRGPYRVAFFTNEHAGCYVLTQRQLRKAIESGGFVVEPHEGRLDLPVTAATDPYTQCGFEKVICLSELQDFLVHHLSNKYAGKYGLSENEFRDYTDALSRTKAECDPRPFKTDSVSIGRLFSKDYYEPVRHDLISLIPNDARNVLSIGCGWGATEAHVAQTGRRVVVVALDSVMALWAERRGLEVISGDLATTRGKLNGESFDCLLISNILHLADDPAHLLSLFAEVLSNDSVVIAAVPNLPLTKIAWKRLHGGKRLRALGSFRKSGVHVTSDRVVRRWFSEAGLKVERLFYHVPGRLEVVVRRTLGLLRPIVAWEIAVIGIPDAKKRRNVDVSSRESVIFSSSQVHR